MAKEKPFGVPRGSRMANENLFADAEGFTMANEILLERFCAKGTTLISPG
jgi:hypothetical protein